jgi:putative Mg2+ transporter-C (MgtC) family protein
MNLLDFCLRLAVALGCGLVIGFERQWRQRNAGLRTCTLVSIGSALFVTVALCTEHEGSPTRIAAQVVTGVGFLGAGCIMRSGLNVRGLNTAGTLWCSAAIGVLAGSGLPLHATIGAGCVILVNVALRPVARLLNRHPASGTETETRYLLLVTCRDKKQTSLRHTLVQFLQSSELRLQQLDTAEHAGTGHVVLKATLSSAERMDAEVEKLANRLGLEPGVTGLSWNAQTNGKSEPL